MRQKDMRQNPKQDKKKKSLFKEVFSWLFSLVILFGAIFLFIQFVGERVTVTGEAMKPSLESGDGLIIDKLSYRFLSPKRYDVVAFPFKYQEDQIYVRRIIALPGETVQIQNGYVFINGKRLDDAYAGEPIKNPGIAQDPVTLARDEYFVLGDNRNHSSDSREPSVGCVTRDYMTGRVIFRCWPLQKLGKPE